ncbi:hypothetical protein [Streptomyces sp. NPDC049040]|uniref:hypothetical protein n=1 Tax=Streptomyces sp. NPDC049040 TaxID=3365593 RepID=UPI003719B300
MDRACARARPTASCCHACSGHITNWDVCTTLSNGILLLSESDHGDFVAVSYTKKAGSAITGKLGWVRNGSAHVSTTLTFSTSLEQEYDWTATASCLPTTGEIVSGSDTFTTPAAPGC